MKLTVSAPTNVRVKRDVNHHVRAWRTHRDLSVEALSKLSGVSGSMISQLERGLTSYTQRTLERLATGLRVAPWQLLACGPDENQILWDSVLSRGLTLSDYTQHEQWCIREMLNNHCDAVAKSATDMFRKMPVTPGD